MTPEAFAPPQKLSPEHDLSGFDCGEPLLNAWLRNRALKNERDGASRTYVLQFEERVVGYYSLAVGAVAHMESPGKIRRNMPDPIPVMVLARLAVDRRMQGRRLGRALMRDALLRTLQAADIAGIRALVVHALSEKAKAFYEANGFAESPLNPMTLMVSLAQARKTLER